MTQLQGTPGRRLTRRLTQPDEWLNRRPVHPIGALAEELAACHNAAVAAYGSNCGGWHAFSPETRETVGVFDSGSRFPSGTVVTNLAWGKIATWLAQRILEQDGVV